jgi:hypothetical protein
MLGTFRPDLGAGAGLRPGQRLNIGAAPQPPLAKIDSVKDAIAAGISWERKYIILLEAIIRDQAFFPYQSLIYQFLKNFEPDKLAEAWNEANRVYVGGKQEHKSAREYLASRNNKPEDILQEDEILQRLGCDRFSLPADPRFESLSVGAKSNGDFTCLTLCNDQSVCANNRQAYSTYADRKLQLFEASIDRYGVRFPFLAFYGKVVRAHRDCWYYASSKERLQHDYVKPGIDPDAKEAAFFGLNIMLPTLSIEQFLKDFIELVSNEGKLGEHLSRYSTFMNATMDVYSSNKTDWLAAVKYTNTPAFKVKLRNYLSLANCIQRGLQRAN